MLYDCKCYRNLVVGGLQIQDFTGRVLGLGCNSLRKVKWPCIEEYEDTNSLYIIAE